MQKVVGSNPISRSTHRSSRARGGEAVRSGCEAGGPLLHRPDGIRLAYAVHGSGPPLVRVATWLTHLDLDWESPVWRHWLATLGERHTVVRYDERGCGLSDPEAGDPSLETWVADLEAVVDAAGWNASRCSASRRGRRSRSRTRPGIRSGQRPRAVRRLRARPEASGPARAGGRRDRGDPGRLDDAPTRPSATCSARCSFRMARPSRRPGTRICFASPHRPRPRCGSSRRAAGSTSASSPRRCGRGRSSSTRETTASSRSRREGCSPR